MTPYLLTGQWDPADRTLEAFELHEGQWLLIESAKDDDPVSIRPFDAITFSLGDLSKWRNGAEDYEIRTHRRPTRCRDAPRASTPEGRAE